MTNYSGGGDDEWTVGCPDGTVWSDIALAAADDGCGCETSPHVLLTRTAPDWTVVP